MIAIDDYFAWIHARIVIIRDLCSYFFLLICSLLMWESSETIYCKNKWAVLYTKPWPPWPDKSVVIREAVAPGPLLSTCPSFTGTKHHQRHHHHHHHLRQFHFVTFDPQVSQHVVTHSPWSPDGLYCSTHYWQHCNFAVFWRNKSGLTYNYGYNCLLEE